MTHYGPNDGLGYSKTVKCFIETCLNTYMDMDEDSHALFQWSMLLTGSSGWQGVHERQAGSKPMPLETLTFTPLNLKASHT